MKTKFSADAPVHIYLRGFDGNLLFYCNSDRLVFYSIFSLEAANRRIKVFSLCLMLNHVHALVQAECYEDLRSFCRVVQWKYARSFNTASGMKGQIFQQSFGWASKSGEKKIRTCLAYIANNPVEKHLCQRAEQNQWTFLEYGRRRYPFSVPYRLDTCPWRLRMAVTRMRKLRQSNAPLTYEVLLRITARMTVEEIRHLTDRIVNIYSVIDYPSAVAYYKSYGAMLDAFATNTGAEYDINEKYEYEQERVYIQMCRDLHQAGFDLLHKDFLKMRDEELGFWVQTFRLRYGISDGQFMRFFHLPSDRCSLLHR